MTEQYRVVTQYTGHPKLGDWESATERPMSLEKAKGYLSDKVDHLTTADLSRVGEFTSIRIEPVHPRDPSAQDALADVIQKALADVTGIYDTSRDEDLALAEVLLSAGYGKV